MDGFQVGKKIGIWQLTLLLTLTPNITFLKINVVFTLHGTAFWRNSVTITNVVKASWSTTQNQVSSHSFDFSHLERWSNMDKNIEADNNFSSMTLSQESFKLTAACFLFQFLLISKSHFTQSPLTFSSFDPLSRNQKPISCTITVTEPQNGRIWKRTEETT